jgi:Domain of unknown function (DUF4340)
MRSRWLLNFALLLLVVLLGLTLMYQRHVDRQPAATRLTTMSPDAIERVRILYADGEEVRLKKQQGKWSLLAPLHARVSQAKVRNLVELVGATSELQLPATAESLRKFGLDTPKAQLWLNDEEIRVGMQHPFKDARYVLYRDRVQLIPAHHFAPASYRFGNLLDTRLLEDERKLVALELPQLSLQLHDQTWELRPKDTDITADRINTFVDEWRYARAFAVGRYSGRPVRDRIRIVFDNPDKTVPGKNSELELGILSYTPELVLYRADEGLEYRFTEDTANRLLRLAGSEGHAPALHSATKK